MCIYLLYYRTGIYKVKGEEYNIFFLLLSYISVCLYLYLTAQHYTVLYSTKSVRQIHLIPALTQASQVPRAQRVGGS